MALVEYRSAFRTSVYLAGQWFNPTRGIGSCRDPDIVDVTALDVSGTRWRVTFVLPLVDNAPLRFTGSYSIFEVDGLGAPVVGGHTPAVLDVVPQNIAEPTFVDLTTEEHREGTTYELALLRVEVA